MAPAERVIWQYWETRGEKPKFIDGLNEIARRNAGVKVVVVTPETLCDYLPDVEDDVCAFENVVQKSDLIRARLVARHGGMWLDSDAIVMADLNWLFGLLDEHEFVGFNNEGRLQPERPFVRANCFLSHPGGAVVGDWIRRQKEKLGQAAVRWSAFGAETSNAACLDHRDRVRILPFEDICPISHKEMATYLERDDRLARQIIKDCDIVMLSNRALHDAGSPLLSRTVEEIAAGDYLLSRVVAHALAGPAPARSRSPAVEVETVFGPMTAFAGDIVTTHLRRYGAHTRVELAFLLSVVRPGDYVFDLGAHIGTFAVPLAQKIGAGGKLLAVEGRAETFALLERNLAAAKPAAEITALNLVVGPHGRYAAHTPDGNTGGTSFVPAGDGEAVATATIDELCARHFTPRVVKLDIEGGEGAALRDARHLWQARPIVYAEINRHALARRGVSAGAIEALLRGNGYRLFRNAGDRNAAHDNFAVTELAALPADRANFDVLAVHRDDARLEELRAADEHWRAI